MPKDVERMVKKLEDKPEIEEPWALATWMKKKGYKMPKKAKEEKIASTVDEYYKKKKIPTYSEVLSKTGKSPLAPKKAEEEPLPKTPGEVMKEYKPKGMGYIDSKPSGKGKPISQYAEEYDPKEMEMGMKEEQEHSETVGHDSETIKKIVIDHLKEDPHYYTKLGTVMKAGEEGKEINAETLKELFEFMKWMQEKGFKADEKEKLEKYIDQFDVEKFSKAEQMEKPPEYTAEEAGVPPLPERRIREGKPAESRPPLPKYMQKKAEEETDGIATMGDNEAIKVKEKAGLGDKIKNFLNPKPKEIKSEPPMTKKSLRPAYRRSKGAY